LNTFYINPDYGSELVIDDNIIVDNDGQPAPVEQSGTVVLKADYHQIKIGFFQASGGEAIDVNIEGPGLQKQIISKDFLFHGESHYR
jgi:hexosaminidase